MSERADPALPTAALLVDGRRVAEVELARSARSRGRGLLGRDHLDGALLIEPTRQVHTFRMRFAIDVAHVDRTGTVLHTATLPPNRVGRYVLRARYVIEAAADRFEAWALRPGTTIEVIEDPVG